MVYLRSGTVVQQPSFLDEFLSIPSKIYNFIMFFVMTLIDPAAAKKGIKSSTGSKSRPIGGSHGSRGGGSSGGGGDGRGSNVRGIRGSCHAAWFEKDRLNITVAVPIFIHV